MFNPIISLLESSKPVAFTCLRCSGAVGGCSQCDGQGWHPAEPSPEARRRLAMDAANQAEWEQEAA
jgi:hypothetical protein